MTHRLLLSIHMQKWTLLFRILYLCIVDILTDEHLLALSKKIRSKEEFMDLGLKVLQLPDFVIHSALYQKNPFQPAAQEILKVWHKKQTVPKQTHHFSKTMSNE